MLSRMIAVGMMAASVSACRPFCENGCTPVHGLGPKVKDRHNVQCTAGQTVTVDLEPWHSCQTSSTKVRRKSRNICKAVEGSNSEFECTGNGMCKVVQTTRDLTFTCDCEEPPLKVGDVCKSGGVETGPGVDRVDDCPLGSECKPKPGVIAIGGEVPWTCQVPVVGCASILCMEGTVCVEDSNGQGSCQSSTLQEGETCYQFCSSGCPFINRRDDCVIGTVCRTTTPPGTISLNSHETCQKPVVGCAAITCLVGTTCVEDASGQGSCQ